MTSTRLLALLAAAALISLLLVRNLESRQAVNPSVAMEKSTALMAASVREAAAYAEGHGLSIDAQTDINQTGLIGPEFSELTTTLGHLEAKRSSLNPQLAGLMAHFLERANVSAGDTILVASSGSFPGLLMAVLSACKVMEVTPLVMLSLGASSYGATRPDWDLLDIYGFFQHIGLTDLPPLAVSLGGEDDVASELDDGTVTRLKNKLTVSGCRFICEADLQNNVKKRLGLFAVSEIKAYFNIGGSHMSLGGSPAVFQITPGLHHELPLPARQARGLMHHMSALNVPVIHLLFLKGLFTSYDLKWDAVPLPVEAPRLRSSHREQPDIRVLLIALITLIVISSGLGMGYRAGLFKPL